MDWIVTEIDGKVASIAADYRHLPHIAAELAALPPEEVDSIGTRKITTEELTEFARFLTWEDIAREFLNSKDDPDQLQNFVNSWLAEPWEDENYRTTSDAVLERQTDCPQFSVPEWAKLLTGGVDVQQNCLYWTIRAWGPYLTSQNIAHGQALDFGSVEEVMNLFYTKEETGEQMLVSL